MGGPTKRGTNDTIRRPKFHIRVISVAL